MQRLADFMITIVAKEIIEVKKEFKEQLLQSRNNNESVNFHKISDIRERFDKISDDINHVLEMHRQCLTMFESENLDKLGVMRENFKFKQ